MHTPIVLVTSYDPSFLAIFEHLVRSEVASGNVPIAFDVTPLLATSVDSYHRGVLKTFRMAYPGHNIEARLTSQGATYLRAPSPLADHKPSRLGESEEEDLEIAVRSALITFTRTDNPDNGKKAIRKFGDDLRTEGRAVYHAVRDLCAMHRNIDRAFLVNGRFPNQKLAMRAFKDAGVATFHLEKGEGPRRAYVQPYAPQDRFRSQASVDVVLAGMTPSEVNGVADEWLSRRAPSSDSSNAYSSLWDDKIPPRIADGVRSGKKIAGFFTSSQDEFQSVGAEWDVHTWHDQFNAFDVVMTRLEEEGYACYLRVHPNLATKAHDLFRRERDGIRTLADRHPNLTVIWHDNQANTYSLLAASDAVVVWGSTVGVEASARGIPVWATSATRYGLVADVRELLSEEDARYETFESWKVDASRAKRFIAYLVLRDQDVVTDGVPWTTWDTGNPPLGVKLAAIAVSGGIPRTRDAVLSLADVYRHRGIGSNLKALRRR